MPHPESDARQPVNLAGLIDTIERFVDDHRLSTNVEMRWLADELKPILQLARQCRSRLPDDLKQRVNAFRALEVEEELAKKRRELDSLESQLKQLRKPVAA